MRSTIYNAILIFATSMLVACTPQEISSLRERTIADRIIGGENASISQFPFVVNIWFDSANDDYVAHLCGGSLVGSRWVLTAAHCMMEDESEDRTRVVKPQKLKLYLGSAAHSGEGGRLLKIKSIHVHPDFSWPRHDLALIELSEAVNDVRPLELETEDLGASTESVTVLGWGLADAEGREESATLQQVTRPLVPRDICNQDPFPRKAGYSLGPETLCIDSSTHQKSSCPGDSGGPLIRFVNNKPRQVGVVSWGSACGAKRSLNGSSVAGYAAVADGVSWIRSVISR